MITEMPYMVAEYTATISLADGTKVTIESPHGYARNEAVGVIVEMTEAGYWHGPILLNGVLFVD